MQLQGDAVCGDEYAVAFEEVQHEALAEQDAAAVHAEQSMEAVGTGPEVCQHAALGVKDQAFHLEVAAAGQELGCGAVSVAQHSHGLTRCGTAAKPCDLERLVQMQRSLLAVFIGLMNYQSF